MKILLFFLAFPLFAVELVNYNIYDRNDRVDLVLSFDNVYKGQISQKKEKNLTLLTFSGLKYFKDELKNLNSQLVDRISISSKDNNTYIMLQNKKNINLVISSINDKFGIRIRAVEQGKADDLTINPVLDSTNNQNLMPKPKSTSLQGYDYINYIFVMLILVILLIVLWWFKKTMVKNGSTSRDFSMVFQRFLDKNNQFVVFDYANKRYIVIIGNSNIFLESIEVFKEDQNLKSMEKTEKNFNSFFEENKKRIQNLIQEHQKNKNS